LRTSLVRSSKTGASGLPKPSLARFGTAHHGGGL